LPPQPHRAFDPQAQVLGDMGFLVLRLNNRGVLGLGAQSRDTLRRDPDGALAADALAAVEWVAGRQQIDRKRIATLGEGFAGYLAVRVTELHPDVFRCAVALDPVLNFSEWVNPLPEEAGSPPSASARGVPLIGGAPPSFQQQVNRLYFEGVGAKLHQFSLTSHADDLSVPVFVASHEVRGPADQAIAAGVSALKMALGRRDLPCVTLNFDDDFVQGNPGARARVYRALEEFFNLNLYHYDVKIGPTRVVK
jgi:pimeloyl-ACP methyl ester carboxylesterase